MTCTASCIAPVLHAILPAPHGCVSCPLIPPPCGTPHCACGAQAVHRVWWRASFLEEEHHPAPDAPLRRALFLATTSVPLPPARLLNQQRYHMVAQYQHGGSTLMPTNLWQLGESGNPTGRLRGSRNKLSEEVICALLRDYSSRRCCEPSGKLRAYLSYAMPPIKPLV